MWRSAAIGAAIAAVTACGGRPAPARPAPRAALEARIVAEFERATLAGPDAWIAQFDFVAVGELEILLHRYDLLGRLPRLSDAERAAYQAEDGTPYPPERERRNVGNFYRLLAQRTVGTGGCAPEPPRFRYNRLLGAPFSPLPPGNASHEPLRRTVNAYLADGAGGVIGIRCRGGRGGVAVVWTRRATARGYDLITIYNDGSK